MNEQILTRRLLRISFWGKFLGIGMMVVGGISALIGVFAFIIGAVPGVLTMIIGYFSFKVGQEAGILKNGSDENAQLALFDNLGKLFLTQGILFIVGIILSILSIFLAIMGIMMLPEEFYYY